MIPFNQENVDRALLGDDTVQLMDEERQKMLEGDPTLNPGMRYFLHRNCQITQTSGSEVIGWVNKLDRLGVHLVLGPDPTVSDPPRALIFWDSVAAVEELVARKEAPKKADAEGITAEDVAEVVAQGCRRG